jgi:hypothetical protein
VFINDVSVREFKAILVGHLYARLLTILMEDRGELFRRVGESLGACFASGDVRPFTFKPWHLKLRGLFVGSFQQIIWPWRITAWSEVESRRSDALVRSEGTTNTMKTHTATLFGGPVTTHSPGGLFLQYRFEPELGRVLMPAAGLIAISNILQEAPDARGLMLSLLSCINRYYVSPDQISLGSDAMAVDAALRTVLSGGKDDIADYRRRDDEVLRQAQRTAEALQAGTSPIDWTGVEKRLADGLGSALNWFRRKEVAPRLGMTPVRLAPLIATVAVILGLANLPYGYYTLLRLFLCGVSLFFLLGAHLVLEDWHRWVLGGLAVLYNPVLPIRIGEKGLWIILNVANGDPVLGS